MFICCKLDVVQYLFHGCQRMLITAPSRRATTDKKCILSLQNDQTYLAKLLTVDHSQVLCFNGKGMWRDLPFEPVVCSKAYDTSESFLLKVAFKSHFLKKTFRMWHTQMHRFYF